MKLDLKAIEARYEEAAKASWWNESGMRHARAKVWTKDIPVLIAAVERLRRELHDERVRRDEWEKMYGQAIAGTEVERLQAELAAVKAVAKMWFKKAMKCKKELNRARQDAQDQSDEVQELWLSPCEAEGLRRQLKQMEAQFVAVGEAVSWLWGFWDGNSLRAIPGFEDDIRDAWEKLLLTVDVPDAALQLLKRLERLKRERDEWRRVAQQERAWVRREQSKLGAAEAELSNGHQALTAAERELKRRQRQIDLLSGAELRAHQAGQRTENLQQEKVGIHEALDECQIPRNYDDGKPASARTRIFWLHRRAERAEALAALVTPELAMLLSG